MMTLLHGYIRSIKEAGTPLSDVKYERIFLYCLTWSAGGLLEMKERPLFDQELRRWVNWAGLCNFVEGTPHGVWNMWHNVAALRSCLVTHYSVLFA